AAGLADQREHLAFGHVERHPVDRQHRAILGTEGDRQVLYGQQQRHRVSRGSRASRSPSPSRLSPRATTTMHTPGITAVHGASRNSGWALVIITPRDGAGGRMPRPRKDSTASPMIAAGAATVAWTISVLTALGRMCRPSTTASLAPSATAAATKSSPRR